MVDFDALAAPFDPAHIDWRVGSTNQAGDKGMALAYLTARAVMDRLDDVCGPGGWQSEHWHAEGKTGCRIGIKIGDEWVWKSDGAGDTQFEKDKGAFSDALKRAAVSWGIGRYLYDLDAPWVAIEKKGRSTFIKNSEKPRLAELLRKGSPKPPPEKWHGPLNKTRLKEEMRILATNLRAVDNLSDLGVIEVNYEDVLHQCKLDLPEWHEGAVESIANKRRELEKVTRLPGEAETFDHDLTMDNLK